MPAALAGLLARDRAFQVEEGTRVDAIVDADMGIVASRISSGFHVGEACYISRRALNLPAPALNPCREPHKHHAGGADDGNCLCDDGYREDPTTFRCVK